MAERLLSVQDLHTSFFTDNGEVQAVNGISFDLDPGEILKQLFATRRNFQKAELQIAALKARLVQLQETLGVMQEVVAEGIAGR